MARNFCRVQWDGDVVLAAAGTPKTILMVTAAANVPVALLDWSVAFEGTSAAAEPFLVELRKFTTAGTATGVASVTKLTGRPETPQFTTGYTFTAEPTAGDLIDRQKVHPQTGVEFRWPCDVVIAGGERVGIRVTVPSGGTAVDATPRITVEE